MDLNIFLSAQTDAVRQAFNPDHIVVYLAAELSSLVFLSCCFIIDCMS